jgi:FlgN protein.
MDINNNIKKTYIQVLIDALEKKYKILNELMQITIRQKDIINSENFDDSEFMNTIEMKEKLISGLSELDKGFELVYDHVRDELQENGSIYKAEIASLKELVTKVTDLSVGLQALEKSNKTGLETLLSRKRKDIGKARLSNKTVASYYKSMSGDSNSYFYDKKLK